MSPPAHRLARTLWIQACFVLVALQTALRLRLLDRSWTRVDVEELRFGLLPHDLIAGLDAPLHAYMTMWREGGSLWMAPIQAPVMAALGGNWQALRVSAIVWNGLLLLASLALLRRVAGVGAALVAGLLLAVGTPYVASSQVLGMANHGEALLPTVLLVLSALGLRGAPGRGRAAGVGLLAGICLSFAFSTAPAVALVLGLLLVPPRLPWPLVLPLLGGLLVGTGPWWAWLALRTDPGTEWRALWQQGPVAVLLGVPPDADILTRTPLLRSAMDFAREHARFALGWTRPDGSYRSSANTLPALLLWGLALVGSVRLILRARVAPRMPENLARIWLVAIVPLLVIVTILAAFPLGPDTFDGYRYLLPIFVPLLLLAGVAFGPGPGPWRALPVLALPVAALLLSGQSIDHAPPRSAGLARIRGWSLLPLAARLENEATTEELLALHHRRPADRDEIAVLVGRSLAIHRRPGDPPPCSRTDLPCSLVIEGHAQALGREAFVRRQIGAELDGLFTSLRRRGDPAILRAAAVGLGRALAFHPPEERWLRESVPLAEAFLLGEELAWFHEGIGLEEPLGRDFHYARHWGGGPVPHHLSWARGVGRGLARLLLDPEHGPDLPPPEDVRAQVESVAGGMDAFRQGFAAERQRRRQEQ